MSDVDEKEKTVGRRSRIAAGEPQGSMSAEELLETSPFAGDLDRELAARPPRRAMPGVTVYLAAGVLLVAGFVGGVQADKQWGSGSTSASSGLPAGLGGARAGGRPGFGGGFGGGGTGGGGFGGGSGTAGGAGGGNLTVGTVTLVDGKTIYVQTQTGTVTVTTNGSTQVKVSKSGSVKDLAPGSTVVVQGTPGSDGSVTASTINQGGLSGGARTGGGG
ncbi:MAG: hypothetical protein JWN00_4716 [Actinomycetia bacterium]|nr:hypothetical protein [Actinomycetes bacterium]